MERKVITEPLVAFPPRCTHCGVMFDDGASVASHYACAPRHPGARMMCVACVDLFARFTLPPTATA